MRLDLTGAFRLQRDHAALLDAIAADMRRPYVELVSKISERFGQDLDWWVTPLACRNTYVCPLFRRLCQVEMARRLAAVGEVTEILVETPAMAALLRQAVRSDVQVRSAISFFSWWLTTKLRMARRFAAALYSILGRYVCVRLLPPRHACPVEPVTLIDTFLYPESLREGCFHDRHFPGLMQHLNLSEKERCHIFWAPVLYRVRNHFSLFRRLRACRDNLLLAEDYLRFDDYAFALGHFLRGRRVLPDCEFLGLKIGPLLREALVEGLGGSGSIEGLLRHRFARRLRETGWHLQRIIEWFENQEIDHGAVSGWLTFHPDAQVVGYQGFLASPNYLCMFPLEAERKYGFLPHAVAVIGSALVDPVREFCPGLEVVVAPAFRFDAMRHLAENKPHHEGFTLLVCLPLDAGESRRILALLGEALAQADSDAGWLVRVKPHPAFPSRLLEEGDRMHLQPGWRLVNEDLDELLEDADLFVGSASSACVQAVVHGVPTAVVGGHCRPTLNTVPEWVDRELWSVCYNAGDLCEMIVRQEKRDPKMVARCRAAGSEVRERLFHPATTAGARELLGLPPRTAGIAV